MLPLNLISEDERIHCATRSAGSDVGTTMQNPLSFRALFSSSISRFCGHTGGVLLNYLFHLRSFPEALSPLSAVPLLPSF